MKKELDKGKMILASKRRVKEVREFWKNFRVMKSFQQQRRRVKTLKEVRVIRKIRGGR